jgi:hypothetical protein
MVDRVQLVQQLNQIERLLRRFAHSEADRKLPWDGRTYFAYPNPAPRQVDPDAVELLLRISIMATLLEYQDSPLTERQIEYLRSCLLGGMLSFSDFALSEKLSGRDARDANEELNRLRAELYRTFNS